MAIASSSYCPSFVSAVSYALAKLGEPHLPTGVLYSCHLLWEGCFHVFAHWLWKECLFNQVRPFVFDHKLGLVVGSSIIVVSPLIALMMDQVRSLRQNGVGAVIISYGSRDTIVDKAFIATGRVAVSFSPHQKPWHTPSGEKPLRTLYFRSMYVLLWLMKPIVCQNGKTIL